MHSPIEVELFGDRVEIGIEYFDTGANLIGTRDPSGRVLIARPYDAQFDRVWLNPVGAAPTILSFPSEVCDKPTNHPPWWCDNWTAKLDLKATLKCSPRVRLSPQCRTPWAP